MIILAPSASGKSTYVEALSEIKPAWVVDGDTIIAAQVGWPENTEWYKSENRAKIVESHNAVLRTHLENYPTDLILFNGDMAGIERLVFACVIIPWEEHGRRLVKRQRYDKSPFLSVANILENRGAIEDFAQRHGLPIYTDFVTADAAHRRFVIQRRGLQNRRGY